MFVIIPVKPFRQAKTRLASILSHPQRIHLSRFLLLKSVRLAGQVGQVVVISRDRSARRLAKEAGAWALVEANQGLNAAIRQATQWVIGRGGQTILIVPADLPLLTLADLHEMIRLGQNRPAVVIAPCQRHDGTNGLLLNPPDLIEVAFGPGSFEKHRQAAETAGLEPIIYRSPTLAFDLDLPEDWEGLREQAADQNEGYSGWSGFGRI